MINVTYRFRRTAIEKAIEVVSDHSCVTDRNATSYHKGLVKPSKAFGDPNVKAAMIGYLGELSYSLYFGIRHENDAYDAHGDYGYDLLLDGFRVDVKTRSVPVLGTSIPCGYIRSVMGNGTKIPLDVADFYFFADLVSEPTPHSVRVRLLGGVSSEDVMRYPDIGSPIRDCGHSNKVVGSHNLNRFTLEDLWK